MARFRPTKQFHPARVLLCSSGPRSFLWLKFTNNSVEMLFPLVTAVESPVKCLIFRRRPFFFDHRQSIGCKMPNFQAETFFCYAVTLLGLDVAHGTKRLPTPDLNRCWSVSLAHCDAKSWWCIKRINRNFAKSLISITDVQLFSKKDLEFGSETSSAADCNK